MMRPSLCVILLLLLQTPLPVTTTDCTPEGFPNYDCQSSSSRSDCVAAHGYSSSNSISEPVLLRYYVFKNNANKYGFYMEWKSPSKDAKSVVGYVIWINRLYLTRLRFELCRYYQIQYTASNNSVVENPVYSLTIDSLEHSNSVYRVEIIALLNSSSSRGGKTSEIFQTYLDLTDTMF
ncbi:hypothetical protein EB796_005913 [Bugula neritina]|uniref:Fibronectin type-III domain-containing protein n=1 Tax=Bugula neritina TaxID=10212 RepID=A0A7J7KDT2_BUGNE|nr:hypothetical protein EB796_005913 [Bugula neritina]